MDIVIAQEKEVINDDGCMVLIEMDANAKVGWEFIKDDPNDTSANGHILLDFIARQNLKILNSSPICEGTVTRQRVTVERTERSVIDYVIACEEMSSFLRNMLVDEKRKYVLTKFNRTHKVESDHNSIFALFNLTFRMKKPVVRNEIFNFKKIDSQKKFQNATSFSNQFGDWFNPKLSTEQNTRKLNLPSCPPI